MTKKQKIVSLKRKIKCIFLKKILFIAELWELRTTSEYDQRYFSYIYSKLLIQMQIDYKKVLLHIFKKIQNCMEIEKF